MPYLCLVTTGSSIEVLLVTIPVVCLCITFACLLLLLGRYSRSYFPSNLWSFMVLTFFLSSSLIRFSCTDWASTFYSATFHLIMKKKKKNVGRISFFSENSGYIIMKVSLFTFRILPYSCDLHCLYASAACFILFYLFFTLLGRSYSFQSCFPLNKRPLCLLLHRRM